MRRPATGSPRVVDADVAVATLPRLGAFFCLGHALGAARVGWKASSSGRAGFLGWTSVSGAECAAHSGTLGPIPKVAAWPRGSWGVSGLVGPVGYDAPSSGSRSDSGVPQPWDDRVWAGSASAHFEFSLPAGESVRPSCRAFRRQQTKVARPCRTRGGLRGSLCPSLTA